MTIIDEILSKVPKDAQVTSHSYEGANIVLYTKNKRFFMHGSDIIRRLVEDFKKRIELRADSAIMVDPETAEKTVRQQISKEADITQIFLDPARSIIVIEARQPGRAIGRDGENLKAIKEKTFWTPVVRRESTIPSTITKSIRKALYDKSAARRKFLHSVGERIYETKRAGEGKEMWARLSFLGGGRQVGRSCYLLQTPESNILVDCGINVAANEQQQYPILTLPEFDISKLDAVVISHAHLDHSGFLPYLFKYGYRGPVYCTEPTRDIMALLQLDCIDVSHAQAKNAIYSSTDVKETVRHTVTLDYGEVMDITPDVRITFYNAGHMIGSSLVHMHIGEGWHNLLYTGDFKFLKTRLLNAANLKFPRVETLLTESTYGAPEGVMEPREKSEKELVHLVEKTIKRKGKMLIPVFGSGRAQEVMVILEKYFRNKKSQIPIYVDGMVWDITAIHTTHPSFLNNEIREEIFYKNKDPFLSPMLRRVGGGKERAKIIEEGPCVIVATSGMLTGGPSVEYLKKLSSNSKNMLCFTGYQGIGSLGRRVQDGEKNFFLEREEYELNMEVHTLAGLSNHADYNELLDYVKNMSPMPRKILVVHGDHTRALGMASTYHKMFRVETIAPKNVDAIRLR